MKINIKILSKLLSGILLSVSLGSHAAIETETTSKTFSVTLGTSRVIYPEKIDSAQVSVSNPQNYPILVESVVTGEDKISHAPFIVTPPLSRIETGQQSRLRIIKTNDSLPKDRESLFWLCVKAIPPSEESKNEDSGKASITVGMSIKTCEKMLYRPRSLKGTPENFAGAIRWTRDGTKLRVNNPTPFYMNLQDVSVDGKKVDGVTYVPPNGTAEFSLPLGSGNKVSWSVINDQGGDSRIFNTNIG